VVTNRSEPKIICWDLETIPDLSEVMKVMPGLSAYPGLTLKATINSIICFGYKIFGEKKTHRINAWDFPGWKKSVNDDKSLCKVIYETLKDADAIVTHNGYRFDLKFLQTRLLKHKLPPLPKIIHIDTVRLAKSNLLMFNNRLDTIAKNLTSEQKMENGGWQLWVDVLKRDKKSMKTMEEYCKQDVNTLEAIYKVLRPFITQMPNYNIYSTIEAHVCPNCGSTRLHGHGAVARKTFISKRLLCLDCSTVSSIRTEKQGPRTL
jgi:DNA polymerase elongation subunit (family B)